MEDVDESGYTSPVEDLAFRIAHQQHVRRVRRANKIVKEREAAAKEKLRRGYHKNSELALRARQTELQKRRLKRPQTMALVGPPGALQIHEEEIEEQWRKYHERDLKDQSDYYAAKGTPPQITDTRAVQQLKSEPTMQDEIQVANKRASQQYWKGIIEKGMRAREKSTIGPGGLVTPGPAIGKTRRGQRTDFGGRRIGKHGTPLGGYFD